MEMYLMTNEFLNKEYELSYQQMRYYDDRHDSLMKYSITLSSSVITLLLAIFEISKGFTQGFYSFLTLISGVIFVATVLLFLAMLRNRLYFVYVVKQINAIREYLLETEAKEFANNQLYTTTDVPALKLMSTQTIQIFGASVLSSLYAGIFTYSIYPAFGHDASMTISWIVFVLVVIVESVGGSCYLASTNGKTADQVIHGKNGNPSKTLQTK
jgi:hypothetical protein